MRRSVLVAVVLVAGYLLYGGVFFAGQAADAELRTGDLDHTHSVVEATAIPETESTTNESFTLDRYTPFEFTKATDGSGFDYGYLDSENSTRYQAITNAGVYVADYDGDGWQDVLTIGDDAPALFRNVGGQFERSGALPQLNRTIRSALWLDYDQDGDEDIIVFSIGRTPLLLENEDERFDVNRSVFEQPLGNPVGSSTADYDGDGCPDLFVAQYGNWKQSLPVGFTNYSVPDGGDNGYQNVLYQGNCGGFERVNASVSGISGTRWSLATSSLDLTGDGAPDIHVANDFNHDVVYVNRGNGRFDRIELPERTNRNGMSSTVGDVNGDTRPDLFVTNIYYPEWAAERINGVLKLKASGNNLLINRGNGTFAERAAEYGVDAGGWGWAAVMADLDNDGDEDLFQATREVSFQMRDTEFSREEIRQLESQSMYNNPRLWAFDRGNRTFRSVNPRSVELVVPNTRGAAQIDYDNDGDLDLLMSTASSWRYQLYENRANGSGALQLVVENSDGTTALGANVTVTAGGHTQWRPVTAGTDFLSQSPAGFLHFGLGNATRAIVTVQWPGGAEWTANVTAGKRVTVRPGGVVQRRGFGGNRTVTPE